LKGIFSDLDGVVPFWTLIAVRRLSVSAVAVVPVVAALERYL